MSNISLFGKKVGMSREFLKSGQSIPVTVLKIEKGRIINLVEKDKRGYSAIQVGFEKIKPSKLRKSQKGYPQCPTRIKCGQGTQERCAGISKYSYYPFL